MDELFCLDKIEWNAVLLSCMAVMFVFRFSLGTIDIIAAKHNEMERERIIHDAIAAGDKEITLTNYYTATKYALPFILDTPENWFNMTVASYYGFDKVYGINPSES